MPGNSAAKAIRSTKVFEKRLQGKNFKDIGKETGTSESTAWRDWRDLKDNDSIEKMVKELKDRSLVTATEATEVEVDYVRQMKTKQDVSAQEAAVVSTIGVNSQKRYSTLAGDVTDDKGGLNIILDD